MTPRRTASQQRTQVPHSATGDSRKDALWGCHSHGKAHFACGPHQKAHSACERSRRMRFSVECAFPYLRKRGATSRKSALWGLTLTEKRILHQRRHRDVTKRRTLDGRRHGKAHFACGPHQRAHSACGRWLRREAILADLCTLLRTHGRSRGRAGPRVPRHRGPHGPRDARALGPEVHATGAVTQPSAHTNSRSLII